MIVVAIIGILAAIAIPNFVRFQMRSKTSEAKTNLAAVRTAQEGYFAEYGVYVQARETPNNPGPQKQGWRSAGAWNEWLVLGWEPEGDVYFQYGTFPTGVAYTIEARSDLDGDGVPAEFAYIHPVPGALLGPAPNFNNTCTGAGVYSAATGTNSLLNVVGPCTALDGQSRF